MKETEYIYLIVLDSKEPRSRVHRYVPKQYTTDSTTGVILKHCISDDAWISIGLGGPIGKMKSTLIAAAQTLYDAYGEGDLIIDTNTPNTSEVYASFYPLSGRKTEPFNLSFYRVERLTELIETDHETMRRRSILSLLREYREYT